MTRQVLHPPFADFMQLLLKGNLLLKHMQHRQDTFARQLLDNHITQPGCVVLAVQGDRLAALTGQTLAMAAWKTQHSLALMIPEQERTSLTNLLTHRQTHNSNTTGQTHSATSSSSSSSKDGEEKESGSTTQTRDAAQEVGSAQQSQQVGGISTVESSGAEQPIISVAGE